MNSNGLIVRARAEGAVAGGNRSDIGLNQRMPIYESAKIKPAVVQVESHPYLPETEPREFYNENDIAFLAFAPLGHGIRPGLLEDPVISAIATPVEKTPAQVLLSWAGQRARFCLPRQDCGSRAGESQHLRSCRRRV
jgi:alcohol dehydrogenase (NADP+)